GGRDGLGGGSRGGGSLSCFALRVTAELARGGGVALRQILPVRGALFGGDELAEVGRVVGGVPCEVARARRERVEGAQVPEGVGEAWAARDHVRRVRSEERRVGEGWRRRRGARPEGEGG